MKVIKIDLPKELKSIEIHIFADEHIGEELSDLESLKKRIEYVKNTPNCSNCGNEPRGGYLTNFCPDCGADMRKGGAG